MPANRIAALPVLLVAASLLSGCAAQATIAVSAVAPDVAATTPSPSESAAPAPSVTPSQATVAPDSGAVSAGDPVSAAPDAGPAAPTADPVCAGDRIDIRVERRPDASGAGQTYSEIVFTNTGDATCTLTGAPSMLAFLDPSTGQKVGVRGSDQLTGEVVALAPGEAGYAVIHFSSVGAHDCPAVSTADARIAPPQWDQSRPVTLDHAVSLCTDRSNFEVSTISATSLEG